MSKNPSATFYFNDWENDPELKPCSLAAQGLWMRLLCIAARSSEHGVVQIGDLNCSLPGGLAHIALAVGRPLEEIAPLIDELLSSGAASQDRKKRITNRRMIRAAALSGKRAKCGKLGADVTNGKRTRKEDLPQQIAGKPAPLHDSCSPNPLLINSGSTLAASASASPDGPPRPLLPDTAKWAERLTGYRPWEGKSTWPPFWGPRPDSLQRNPTLELYPNLLNAWRAEYQAAKARGEAA